MNNSKHTFLFICLGFLKISTLSAQTEAAKSARFEILKNHFHQKTDAGVLPGTVILLSQNGQKWLDCYGKSHIETGQAMNENTIFRLASMTKPLTSTAAMMLIEQGKMGLDDPVAKYLPGFENLKIARSDSLFEPLSSPITVRHLLTHTSGISNDFFQNTPAERAYTVAFQPKRATSLADLVGRLETLPLAHQPGEKWTYGFSTDVLSRVIEVVSGEPFGDFLKKRILQPLKMEDTDFQVSPEKLPRFAANYGKNLRRADAPDASSPFVNGKNFPHGAGGLTSTAGDYLRFCQMILNDGTLDGVQILKPESVEAMMRNQLAPSVLPHSPGMPPICNGFGLGFGVQTESAVFGSAGDCAWPGANLTYFFIDPTHQGIGILMTQSLDFSNLALLGDFHNLASAVFSENWMAHEGKN